METFSAWLAACDKIIFNRLKWSSYHISLSYPLYNMWGCVFSLPIFLRDDWDNIHTLSYYHHQIESMNYYALFRVRSWNNGMRCMSFYILMTVIQSSLVYSCDKGPVMRSIDVFLSLIWIRCWTNFELPVILDVVTFLWRHCSAGAENND